MSLLNELKRRNVLRVAVLYVVIAWIILQVAALLFDVLKVPDWGGKLVLVLLILGLPLVLVFAWAFEITPEGIKRESEVDRTASITPQTGRKINVLTGVLGAVAILLIIAQAFIPGLKPSARQGSAAAPVDSATKVNSASIAVLPFVDMSAGKDQEYFSDGLSEELLNLLAKIPELTVISRTSSFQFKGKNEDVRVIAQKLNVAHVLEGSVRKAADTVRITAQLINAGSGAHLWSETYTRPMANIFAVQDEIASEVVKALRVKILGAAPQVDATSNVQAFDLLLKARDIGARRGTREGLDTAVTYVRQAIALDSTYAPAWTDLSRLLSSQAAYAFVPYRVGFENARRAAQRAIELDPKLADGYTALALVEKQYDWDWSASEAHIRTAETLDPASLLVLSSRADLAKILGRLDEAIAYGRKLTERDPLRPGANGALARSLINAGRAAEAVTQVRKALELAPQRPELHSLLARAFVALGKPQEALTELQAEVDPFWQAAVLPLVYHALGRQQEVDASLRELEKCCAHEGAFQLAEAHAYVGNIDAAFKWLDRAYQDKDPGLPYLLSSDMLKNLRSDARYRALVRKLKLPES